MGNHAKIDELIASTDDPVAKAMLMLISRHESSMGALVASLEANTHATRKISDDVAAHIAKEEIFQAKVQTSVAVTEKSLAIGWKIVAVLGMAFFSLVVWIWQGHLSDSREVTAKVYDLDRRVTALEHAK